MQAPGMFRVEQGMNSTPFRKTHVATGADNKGFQSVGTAIGGLGGLTCMTLDTLTPIWSIAFASTMLRTKIIADTESTDLFIVGNSLGDGNTIYRLGSDGSVVWGTILGTAHSHSDYHDIDQDEDYIYVAGLTNNTWPSASGYAQVWKLDKIDGTVSLAFANADPTTPNPAGINLTIIGVAVDSSGNVYGVGQRGIHRLRSSAPQYQVFKWNSSGTLVAQIEPTPQNTESGSILTNDIFGGRCLFFDNGLYVCWEESVQADQDDRKRLEKFSTGLISQWSQTVGDIDSQDMPPDVWTDGTDVFVGIANPKANDFIFCRLSTGGSILSTLTATDADNGDYGNSGCFDGSTQYLFTGALLGWPSAPGSPVYSNIFKTAGDFSPIDAISSFLTALSSEDAGRAYNGCVQDGRLYVLNQANDIF